MKPLISIIIPSYNRAHLIGDTIDSVIAQTYKNWECIVVEDRSVDNSLEVIEEFVSKDSRVQLYQRNRDPKGASTCRNIGAMNSKGNYLVFLDSDDILAPYCLEKRINFMTQHREYDFYVFNAEIFSSRPGDTQILWNSLLNDEKYLLRFLKHDVPWCITSLLWDKDYFLKVGMFDEEPLCWQDWEIHVRALLRNPKFEVAHYSIPDCFIRRKLGEKTIGSREKEIKFLISKLELLNRIFKDFYQNQIFNDTYRLHVIRIYFKILSSLKLKCIPEKLLSYRTLRRTIRIPITEYGKMLFVSYLSKMQEKNRIVRHIFYWLANRFFGNEFVKPASTLHLLPFTTEGDRIRIVHY